MQPILGASKSNLDALRTGGSISEKLFPSLDSTRPAIISSIAKIWDDNIVDDKPWAVPTPLAPVQLEDFARNINVQLPHSVKSVRDFPIPSAPSDQVADLAKNIANLRTTDDRPISNTGNEALARRSFMGENVPSFDLSAPFPSRDPVDWSNTGSLQTDSFTRWRSAALESTPSTTSIQEIDSSSWIDQVAARLASARQERLPFSSTTSYAVPGNPTHISSSFGTDAANISLGQQQQPTQAWNRMHLQQASQAASNEYENLTNLLSSCRPPAGSQHQPPPPPPQQQPPQPIMPLGNINYGPAAAATGPTGFPMSAPRSQIANTSVPPPPFFNSQIPPPSPMSHRAGIPVTQSAANTAWPSVQFGAQTQASNIAENPQYPQYSNTTRGNWSYNW